jgi:hypothetical protein
VNRSSPWRSLSQAARCARVRAQPRIGRCEQHVPDRGDGRRRRCFNAICWLASAWTPRIRAHAGVDSQGHQYAFSNGIDDNLSEAWWDGTKWNGPASASIGPLGASPAVAVAANRDQNIFWSGTNSDLREGPLRRQQTEPPLNVK